MTATQASTVAKIQAASAEAQAIGSVPPPSGNYLARINSPTLLRHWDWSDPAQLNGGFDENVRSTPSHDGLRRPTIDTAFKSPDGTNSLLYTLPGNTVANAAGTWAGNIATDLKTGIGENESIFTQVPIWWNDVMVDTVFLRSAGGPQDGVKFFDVVGGDVWGGVSPRSGVYTDARGITKGYSSGPIKVVAQGYHQHDVPIAYRYKEGNNANLYETVGSGSDFKLQNGMPSPFCLYTVAKALADGATVPGCWRMPKFEWVYFQLGIGLGAKGYALGSVGQQLPVWLNSWVKLWVFWRGVSYLLVDYHPGIQGYFPLSRGPDVEDQKFSLVTLFPYMTDKDPTQAHGVGLVRYGPLIIDRQRIADPT